MAMDVPVRVYFKDSSTGEDGAPVIVYVKNHGYPRIGQEPDSSILADFVGEMYLVVVVDFEGNPKAVSPDFDWDLLELQRAIYGYKTTSLLTDVGLVPQEYYGWFVPAGCRLARDVVYFELDKHGSYGTKEWVLKTWNTHYHKKFDVPILTDPNDMYDPDGSPIDYQLSMDIIYPSEPSRKLPLWFYNATRAIRMECFRCEMNEPHMYGFAMRGYVTAIIDHCWNPLSRRPMSWGFINAVYNMDQWNGLKRATAAVRFFRAHADRYGIDAEHICGWGYSKGSYGITRLSDPEHESQEELATFAGYPPGSPEAQPWQDYSSRIGAGYQAVGMGTRNPQYITSRQVPTVTACGKFDKFKFWPIFPALVQEYESHEVPHLALWMEELAHELPWRYDERLGRDRYALVMQFFDQVVNPHDHPAPEVLYTFPKDQATEVTRKGYSQALPDVALLPADAFEYVSLREPITVHFGQRMDVESVTGGGVEVVRKADGARVAGAWTALRGNTYFQFEPASNLEEQTAYLILITTKVRNEAGVALGQARTVEFVTGSDQGD
ncbi:MAG: Ig-like domain-containing protein [Sedimentisphaerales bacterium]|nr:Ig-like domain-containing protein [Sedimentisphaerales bacterium]